MKMTSTELIIMRRAATAIMSYAKALELSDPKEAAALDGWTPDSLRHAARTLHHIADEIRTADEIFER